MNKFEQISNLDHQMLVAGEGLEWSQCPMSAGDGFGGRLYCEIQCIIGNGHKGPPCEQTDRQK